MLRPLHTVIRNLTDQTLIFGLTPKLFIAPNSEQELDYDPFTRTQNTPVLERMLVSAHQGKIQIVYKVDPQYATIAGGESFVRLSWAAQQEIGAQPQPAAPKEEKKEPSKLRNVPFGKTLDEVNAESTSSAEVKTPKESSTVTMVSNRLDPAVRSPEVTISKEAAQIVDQPVDINPTIETEAASKKKRSSKKAVTTL